MQIRRTVAAAGLSVAALTGFAAVPANAVDLAAVDLAAVDLAAVDLAAVDCTNVDAAITTAKDAQQAAQRAYSRSHRPLGQQLKAERAEARAEAKDAKDRIKTMNRQLAKSDGADRKATLEALKTQRKALAEANAQLDSKKLLLAEISDQRDTAKATVKTAKAQLQDLRDFRSTSCADAEGDTESDVEAPETDEGTEVDAGTGAEA